MWDDEDPHCGDCLNLRCTCKREEHSYDDDGVDNGGGAAGRSKHESQLIGDECIFVWNGE